MSLDYSGKVSVIIRTYNEAEYIGRLLECLNSQGFLQRGSLEVVIVDSGSTDATVDIAKRYDVILIEISQEEFNYSTALNMGVENSTGDFVVILSAHSIPSTSNWLEIMLDCFKDDTIAGVCCKQIPWPDAPWREIERIKSVFGNQSRILKKDSCGKSILFSNAASCVRRSVWEKHKFQVLPAAEDVEWAQWAVGNNYKIFYMPSISVYHSHKDTPKKLAQRSIEIVKAQDVRCNINRTKLLTVKQGLGWLYKDSKRILKLQCDIRGKTRAFIDQIKTSFWFIICFNKNNENQD